MKLSAFDEICENLFKSWTYNFSKSIKILIEGNLCYSIGDKGKNVNGETRNTDRLRHCLINRERWLGKRYENLLKHFSESKILVFKYSSLVHIFHSFSPFNSNKIPYLSHKSKKKRR